MEEEPEDLPPELSYVLSDRLRPKSAFGLENYLPYYFSSNLYLSTSLSQKFRFPAQAL